MIGGWTETFGSLLNEVLDVAVVGDDEPVGADGPPRVRRAVPRESSTAGRRRPQRWSTAVNGRTSGLHRALGRGPRSSRISRRGSTPGDAGSGRTCARPGAAIAGRDLGTTQADGLWAVLTMEVYDLLTGSAGWSPALYEQWLTDTIFSHLHSTRERRGPWTPACTSPPTHGAWGRCTARCAGPRRARMNPALPGLGHAVEPSPTTSSGQPNSYICVTPVRTSGL